MSKSKVKSIKTEPKLEKDFLDQDLSDMSI